MLTPAGKKDPYRLKTVRIFQCENELIDEISKLHQELNGLRQA